MVEQEHRTSSDSTGLGTEYLVRPRVAPRCGRSARPPLSSLLGQLPVRARVERAAVIITGTPADG